MNTFRKNKFIYEEILEMEEQFNNTPMEYIKENLFQVKLKKKEEYTKNCKNNNRPIGRFRVLEGLVSKHAEESYFNKAHPSNIPFMVLIRICNYLKINFDDIIKEPVERKINHNIFINIKWTEELIQEFINDYEIGMNLEDIAKKYDISANTVLRFYPKFKDGNNCNGKVRR